MTVSAGKQLLNLFCAILVIRIGDFLLLTYVNKYVNKLEHRTNIRLLLQWYRIPLITSSKRRHSWPDSYDKCERGLNKIHGREIYIIVRRRKRCGLKERTKRGAEERIKRGAISDSFFATFLCINKKNDRKN